MYFDSVVDWATIDYNDVFQLTAQPQRLKRSSDGPDFVSLREN